jgi:glutaredoxin
MHARQTLAVLAAALLLPAVALAQSTVYRWVDKDGKVQYSDSPPDASVKDVSQKRLGGATAEAPQLPVATQLAMKSAPVVLYVSASCGEYCSQGRALLAKRGTPYSERDVSNAADADAVKSMIGSLGVPVLAVGGKGLKGFSEAAWNGALDAAGYPRTALPGQRNPLAPPVATPAPSPPPPPPRQPPEPVIEAVTAPASGPPK